MKKNFKYLIFLIATFLIFQSKVFAITCKYNASGYSNEDAEIKVEVSSTSADLEKLGSAWDDFTLLWSRNFKIQNWNKNDSNYWNGKVSYEASDDFKNECPKYLVSRYVVTEGENFYFFSENNVDYWKKELQPTLGALNSYIYIKEDDDSDYESTISCTYDDFIIDYTDDGKAISIKKNGDSKLFNSVNDTVKLSSAIQTKYSKWNGSCPTVCYTKNEVPSERKCVSGGGGMTVCFDDYRLYYNFNDAGNKTCTVESCIAGTEGCKVNSDGSTFNGICDFYDSKLEKVEEYYSAFDSCDSSNQTCQGYNLQEANKHLKILENFCSSAYASVTYSDPCVRACLGYERKVADLKDKYHVTAKESQNANCSLSSRLVAWIMKIINWMRYIVPVLLILLSILDYIKAIASDSEDEVKKVTGRFVKRLIVAVCIFLVPLILQFLLGIFGIDANNFCL